MPTPPPCNATPGNAEGCELQVYDISTPSLPTLVAGRDGKGDATGTGGSAIFSLTISGSYLYVGKSWDATACNGTAGNAIGCELLVFGSATSTISGALTGTNALNNLTVKGAVVMSNSVTTTNLSITTTSLLTAPSQLTVKGDYTNNGTFAHNSGTVYLDKAAGNIATLVGGWDAKGDVTGTGDQYVYSLTTSGNYLYVGKQGDTTACNGTAGNAIGCELLIYDNSIPSSPTLLAGRDEKGNATGTGSLSITSLAISGNYLYVGKWADATACNGTAGNAIGCELLVFDISTPSSPTLVAGRDAKGDTTGTGGSGIYSLTIFGTYLYVGKDGEPTACDGTAGNAIGCELLVFDISTPSLPTLVAGRDVKGDTTGTGNVAINSLTTSGNYLYVGKNAAPTACDGTAGNAIGCELLVFGSATSTISGALTGTNALNNLTVKGAVVMSNQATTTNLSITTTSKLFAPSLLSILGDYTNSGTFTAGSGTTTLNGTGLQTATGTMTGTSAFTNLVVTNSSATTTFGSALTTTGNFVAATPGSRIEFAPGATTTVGSFSVVGSSGNEVYLFSDVSGSQWRISATGTVSVSYARVKDSFACIGWGNITASNSTNSGGNYCWDFDAGGPNMTVYGYLWREDNGTESQASAHTNENTTSNDKIWLGDRLRLRVLVSNTGSGSAENIGYRLQYASTSCSTWVDVMPFSSSTPLEWKMDLSQWLPEGAVTTNATGVLTDPGGKSFTAGEGRVYANQTSPHTLSTAQFTEHEYAIVSTALAQSGVTYCFRLTNQGNTTNFTYSQQPQMSLTSRPRPQAGGTGAENGGNGNRQTGGGMGGGAGSEGQGSGGGQQTGGGQGGGGGDAG